MSFLKRILSYPLTVVFYVCFGLLLLIFHPIQMMCLHWGGYHAHKRSVDILNFLILKCFIIVGATIKFKGFEKLPSNRPLIIVSNHQSAWDVPPIVWSFRKHHPKFISKIELAKNIPSVSYNLKHGGSAIIDRNKGSQSIREVIKLGEKIEKNNFSVCIFPEGTRSENGQMRKFQPGGIKTLLKAAPSAIIIPFVINGNINLQPNKSWAIQLGVKLNFTVLDPIEPAEKSAEELIATTEQAIGKYLSENQK